MKIVELEEMFKRINTNKNRQTTLQELRLGLKSFRANLNGFDIYDLMQVVSINLGEFLRHLGCPRRRYD